MKSILLLVAAICVAISFAEFDEHQTLFLREGVPANSGYSILRKAESAHKVKFTISLQQRNLDQLEAKFWANADPKSPVYAQHMTRAEVMALIAPTMKTQKTVLRWIHSVADSLPKGNVFEVDNQQDAIVVTSTALFAEKLFRTEMFLFFNERNNVISCKHIGQLSIPASLKSSITFVSGITELEPVPVPKEEREGSFVSEKAKASRQTADNQCNTAYSLKNLYNVPTNLFITEKSANSSIYAEPSAGSQDGFGLGSIEDYQTANGLPKNPITCILGNGAQYYITNDTDTEANLDTEMMTGMAPNADVCFYLMEAGNGWMYEFSREIFNTPNAPLVVSMSYGWNEVDSCNNITAGYTFLGNCTYYHIPDSQTYVNLTNVNFQKLGVVGHTLLAAAGDDGIAGTHGSLNNCETQGPIFPAASPFVTTVGATSIEVSASPKPAQKRAGEPAICSDTFYQCVCSTSNNEQVAEGNNTAQFDTGGGFSMFSSQPAYQAAAVQAYLKSGVELPPKQYFNGNNRGFPDIAAVGENICLLNPGQPCEFVGGTSASTPIIAALITLLNNDRIAAGKTPLGFFNPVIYDMFAADSDKYFNNKFEYGNNAGECPSDMGFNTKSGFWTPLTGCGSPNFETIRAYVAQLK